MTNALRKEGRRNEGIKRMKVKNIRKGALFHGNRKDEVDQANSYTEASTKFQQM